MTTISPQGGSELRIVILGNDEENKVVKSVLNCEKLTGVEVGLCTLHQGEQTGRKISVVEAPGWDRLRPDRIKEEIVRSVSLCPPGPHALLLVIPVKTTSGDPSVGEINASEMHMRLLSERVWKHTIVVFACDDGVDHQTIQKHIHSAEKILEKCGRRSHVLQKSTCEPPSQIHDLLKKIYSLVKQNHGGFFIPQAYYELIQQKTQEASETELRKRRGSMDSPPSYNKDTGDSEKKESVETPKPSEDKPKITMDFKTISLILFFAFGAVLGAVAGSESGVSGACSGLVFGVVLAVLLASFIVYIYTHIYSSAYPKQPTQSSS
ncbi:GTPase IMAP family member 4-like [Carassius gibelio]|uniref:GTPase IMAP family member 4-like n=1 Tax=Carassius gibelio TaxID=101364 RepID=UPI0022793434|nr:GTPase IMAP family member 4-like [Carassius gibelio]